MLKTRHTLRAVPLAGAMHELELRTGRGPWGRLACNPDPSPHRRPGGGLGPAGSCRRQEGFAGQAHLSSWALRLDGSRSRSVALGPQVEQRLKFKNAGEATGLHRTRMFRVLRIGRRAVSAWW